MELIDNVEVRKFHFQGNFQQTRGGSRPRFEDLGSVAAESGPG